MNSSVLKIILILVIVGGLIFYPLYIAKAVSGWLIVTKEYVLDLIARVIGRVMTSTLGNAVTKTILESGREKIPGQKTPAFVQDWREFMQRAQYRGEDLTRATIADATLGSNPTICPYLRTPLTSAFGANSILDKFDSFKYRVNSLQYYKERNRCTLPAGFNVNTFRNDFSAGGGWATWDKLIQPQNNFFGVYADSLDELSKQRGFEENIDKSEAESGSGYTSKRTRCSGSGANQQCTILGKVVTPADIFGKTGAETLTKEFKWLASVDEIQEALVSLVGMVVNRLENFANNSIDSAFQDEDQKNLGTGTGEAPPPPNVSQQILQDCIGTCVDIWCPPYLVSCDYEDNCAPGETGTCPQIAINHPCNPEDLIDDVDPRDVCITDCKKVNETSCNTKPANAYK